MDVAACRQRLARFRLGFYRSFARGRGVGGGVARGIGGGRCGVGAGWEWGRAWGTGPWGGVRRVPGQDATEVPGGQIREVFGGLREGGRGAEDPPPVLVVLDAGY